MPILRLNVGPTAIALHGSPAPALPALRRAASSGIGPVFVLVHGFKYDPCAARHSPHDTIFALRQTSPRRNHHPWLPGLGFGAGQADEGLAIAFAWTARTHLHAAWRTAQSTGAGLARVIQELKRAAPHRPVHVIAHSMGSEVIFAALEHLAPHDVQRIVTLTGASYASRARAAMHTQAGQTAELFNVTSGENALFDRLFETLIPCDGQSLHDCAMGRCQGSGHSLGLRNAVTLRLDCAGTLAALCAFGGHIAPRGRHICHWSCYTRPGALQFYANALRRPEAVPLHALRAALPAPVAPRWPRLLPGAAADGLASPGPHALT